MGYMNKPRPGKNPYAGAHGQGVRGDRDPNFQFQGRFGRLFPDVPRSNYESDDLLELGWAMTADPERVSDVRTDPGFYLPSATAETEIDGEENPGISAGYTYFGQFMDHDMTFDSASTLQGRNDPNAMIDFRSPALDMDCLYGRGPADQPYMYKPDGKHFQLGSVLTQGFDGPATTRDLPRYPPVPSDEEDQPARALIGDKRNDENVIVSQLQGVFLHFHNRMVDDHPTLPLEEIQRLVRWHYQWCVVNDFLPTIVGTATMKKIWPQWTSTGSAGTVPVLKHYFPKENGKGYMPIEFSAAAYRFGHSMVRPIYRLNKKLDGGEDPQTATPQERSAQHIDGRFFIFAGVIDRGLNGFNAFPSQWAIDWSLFFDIHGSAARTGKERLQPAYKIDSSIVNPLGFLPEFSSAPFVPGSDLIVPTLQSTEADKASPSNLAVRNLWRGNSMQLPSGQAIAIALGETPLAPEELFIGKAQLNDALAPDDKPLAEIAHGRFVRDTPLWCYVLAEANAQWRKDIAGKVGDAVDAVPVRLGPVGGRIVAETILGLLKADKQSYLAAQPGWTPTVATATGSFRIADLITYAMAL